METHLLNFTEKIVFTLQRKYLISKSPCNEELEISYKGLSLH